MAASDGSPVVVTEAEIVDAHELACRSTGLPVSPTGSAGLAGLLALRPSIDDGERVAVLFTGRSRAS